jgi:hypothetical protein
LLSSQWKEKYDSFLEEEHWNEFVSKLAQHVQKGIPVVSELPYFEEEIRIPEEEIGIPSKKHSKVSIME